MPPGTGGAGGRV